ncbi:MAG: hypothetical protein ACD_22C00241G0004 [uncultured bacterium]|nr:MAG: hypothetical protein ACD_22C00241G0004 [uncultured bacterium]
MRFFGYLLKVFILLLFIYFIYSNFFYISPRDGCFITILPSFLEFNNKTVLEAITILKNASNQNYVDLCKNVKVINPNPNCGGYNGGCFYLGQTNKIHVNISNNNPSLTAAVITHEVCHLLQSANNNPLSEDECYRKDDSVLREIVQL